MNAVVATTAQVANEHWPHVAPMLTPPETEADYERLVALLDEVLDAGGADEDNALASLADRMGELVAAYEAAHVPELNLATGVAVLRHLMDVHSLRQSDLPEIGPQSVVSDVLRGKRRLHAEQMRRLAQRFGQPMDVFAAR